MANAIRLLSVDAIEKAKSGHPGMAMGIADVITVIFSKFLKFNPLSPEWPDRDRIIFSAGHGVMALYAALYLSGHHEPTLEDIKNFRQLHSKTPGHPEFGHTKGVEATTGPLGQGVANAVGMAMASKILQSRLGKELVDHRVFVIAGDGCLMEGITHEAASLAGHLGLDNLIMIFDSNEITIDGKTNLAVSEDAIARFAGYGWDTISIDGHDFDAIEMALNKAVQSSRPVFIECKTVIARGAVEKAGSHKSHGSSLGAEEVSRTRVNLCWPHDPFVIPEEVLQNWRKLGSYDAYNAWNHSYQLRKSEFDAVMDVGLDSFSFDNLRSMLLDSVKADSTRSYSGKVIEHLIQHKQQFVGGSADLTESNCVRGSAMRSISKGDFTGSFIHYGVREHAMAAIMNGISLHGGLVPYGGTFLVFSDYMRPAIRLSAIMGIQVIYVMTHDSIGVGEDGPTHQPVEHLASLRAIPNLLVLRPADIGETIDAWEIALSNNNAPSVIVLTRQPVSLLFDYSLSSAIRLGARFGAYIIQDCTGDPDVTILATGSEVALALQAASELKDANGLNVKVVSMPCWRLFERQDPSYKKLVLGTSGIKVAIEAATRMGWDRYIGSDGVFIGVDDTFGFSAPAKDLFEKFGLTVPKIVSRILEEIKNASYSAK